MEEIYCFKTSCKNCNYTTNYISYNLTPNALYVQFVQCLKCKSLDIEVELNYHIKRDSE